MSDGTPRSSTLPDDDPQTGEPIRELKELELDTSPFFLGTVRKKIHRRTTSSQFLSFSWQMPKTIVLALANLMVHILSGFTVRKGD